MDPPMTIPLSQFEAGELLLFFKQTVSVPLEAQVSNWNVDTTLKVS